ncbi:thioredoxin-like protein [Polychytrium aggregatum]|uniref:thioredoxin-like protein n=1 Tax=Polychytrium aggregatum TaxID=110093 RepID=UPI0022FE224B|nr:thioredoxin-like protein [Polychytrium aggregatum]KAI9193125.1 thioredoxin-like protein [Polychytrium aggregatum]
MPRLFSLLIWVSLCWFALAAAASRSGPVPSNLFPDSKVVQVDDSSLDDLLTSGEWLVEFYAPWCLYCKQVSSEFEIAAEEAESRFPNLRIARVNIDNSPRATVRFQLSRLPSYYYISDKSVRYVEFKPRASEILEFLEAEEWKSIEPYSEIFAPFSPVMQIVGYVGSFGSYLVVGFNSITKVVPAWVVVSGLAFSVFSFLSLGAQAASRKAKSA